MLRRAPTIITLTPEDIQAYDDAAIAAPPNSTLVPPDGQELHIGVLEIRDFKRPQHSPFPQLGNPVRDAQIGVNTFLAGE